MPQTYARSPRDYLRALVNYTRELNPSNRKGPNLVMYHVGRSGSTVLGDLLDQHPDLHWDKEVLLDLRVKRYARLVPFRKRIINDPIKIIHWRMLLSDKRRFGFETMPHHLEPFGLGMPEYLLRLRSLNFRHVIILKRENSLRLIVSYLKARQGQWHSFHKSPSPGGKTSIAIQIDDVFGYGRSLQQNLDYFSNFHEGIDSNLPDYEILYLTYEKDIALNPLIAYEKCCQFLNLNPFQDVSVRLKKLNPFPLRAMIENYEEVEKNLVGTRYEWMLVD